MATYVVVGLQYGDEGKGKITDVLSAKSDYVVRFQGGDNAGHTVYVGDEKFVLHLLPSGVLQCKGKCIIANGVVVNPKSFIKEIEQIESKGMKTDHVFISRRAHVIMPYHILLDKYREEEEGGTQIGTTKKGIGPCYEDKIARVGIRMIDLLNPEVLAEKIKKNLKIKNSLFEKYFEKEGLEFDEIYNEFIEIGKKLQDRIVDTELEINQAIQDGKNILFEGAQALMLDIDFGTYPYVTSSSPTTGGVCSGAGVPPTSLQNLIGVAKAYTTRVGNGPFPTELDNELGEKIRQIGFEFGATTGRPRRTGWLDLVSLKHATMINGINNLVITKLDVLFGNFSFENRHGL
jgi:Adenylosuccinate synthetase (EC 6.3.4.4)